MLEQLVPPNAPNHQRGKGLILVALSVTSYFKGDWVMAHGLLGTTMLECDVFDRLAYRSLFSAHAVRGGKLFDTTHVDNGLLAKYDAIGGSVVPINRSSLIFNRESAIYALATNIEARYIYDNRGNYGSSLEPDSNRRDGKALLKVFDLAFTVFNQLKQRGYVDATLRDALGMAYASLARDGYFVKNAFQLGVPLQTYSDALRATLAYLQERPTIGADFLEELEREMIIRGLAVEDKMLLPDIDENGQFGKNFESLLKIVEADLDAIKNGKP